MLFGGTIFYSQFKANYCVMKSIPLRERFAIIEQFFKDSQTWLQ